MKANTTPLPAAQIALLGKMRDAIRRGAQAHYTNPPKGSRPGPRAPRRLGLLQPVNDARGYILSARGKVVVKAL